MAPSDVDLAAREALRARQGAGARYDAPNAPAEDLLLARRGAAFFARKLNELSDAEFAEPARRPGWTRAAVAADVSFRARAMALALKDLREGLTEEEAAWAPDMALAVTLPVRALRNLYHHSDVHLNVEFRDLRPEDWEGDTAPGGGPAVPARGLPRLRARDLWLGAIDLDNGARPEDLPPALAEELEAELSGGAGSGSGPGDGGGRA